MKKNLLLTFFSFFLILAISAQSHSDCDGCPDSEQLENKLYHSNQQPVKKISIYPNPASEFIGLKHADGIKEIMIYNVVGRKMKSFTVNKGEQYYIADLPKGMYLVQMLDYGNKIVTTQRINKR